MLFSPASRWHRLLQRLLRGEVDVYVHRLREMVWSEKRFVEMRRDLSHDIATPKAPVRFSIRPFAPGDETALFDSVRAGEEYQIRMRQRWLDAGLTSCYVAVLEDGRPCFVQWLFTAADNRRLGKMFAGTLPEIEPDAVLLEGAYTPPRFRRLSIMPAAMARIAEEGRRLGANCAVVCVGDDLPVMYKAAGWAGFVPHRLMIYRRRLFCYSVTYAELPGDLRPRVALQGQRAPSF